MKHSIIILTKVIPVQIHGLSFRSVFTVEEGSIKYQSAFNV